MTERHLGKIFYVFSDTPSRRKALAIPGPHAQDYALYGLRTLESYSGIDITHNLEDDPPGHADILRDNKWNQRLARWGGYGGAWSQVLPYLKSMNRSDLVVSTVDRVGIPLMILRGLGLLRTPLLYIGIGTGDRVRELKGAIMPRLYRYFATRVQRFVFFGFDEREEVKHLLQFNECRGEFLPFSVNVDAIMAAYDAIKDKGADRSQASDILTIGADPQRDFSPILEIANERPELKIRLIISESRRRHMPPVPENVSMDIDAPFEDVLAAMSATRVLVLPVHENTYTGATTTLQLAMAAGRAVVVSRTSAIRDGYGLVDGVNCRMVSPGDNPAFKAAVFDLLENDAAAKKIGQCARELAQKEYGRNELARKILGELEIARNGNQT